MKLAIMQPYFFPYLGYFQLINAVDKFVFYDDVNFIKNGWINRNRIIINNAPRFFTVHLKDASSFKLIKELEFSDNRHKLKKTVQMAYKKAPFFNFVWPILEECLEFKTKSLSELAVFSVKKTCDYLGVETQLEISSDRYSETYGFEKSERIKAICKRNGADTYINSIGGKELYQKENFAPQVKLIFLKANLRTYKQYVGEFIPGLSVIDVMMFNSVDTIRKMLDDYELC